MWLSAKKRTGKKVKGKGKSKQKETEEKAVGRHRKVRGAQLGTERKGEATTEYSRADLLTSRPISLSSYRPAPRAAPS